MEMSKQKMTCVEAVHIMISRWKVGESKTGAKIEREVRVILFDARSDAYPSGKTITRRFQEQKPFDIASTMEGKYSKYERFPTSGISMKIVKKTEKTQKGAHYQVV